MEHRQLEQRLRLDIPTLADPAIRDLLHESDLFVRSFNGLGFGFGLFSPFDLIRVLSSIAEVASQLYVLYSTTQGSLPFLTSSPSSTAAKKEPNARLQVPLLAILILPTLFSLLGSLLPSLSLTLNSPYALSSDPAYYSARRCPRIGACRADALARAWGALPRGSGALRPRRRGILGHLGLGEKTHLRPRGGGR